MAPDPDGDGAEAGSLTSATPGTLGRSPKASFSYSIEYASRRLKGGKSKMEKGRGGRGSIARGRLGRQSTHLGGSQRPLFTVW